jgi:signal transduction histidine kinase
VIVSLFPLNFAWARYLSWARALLAAVALLTAVQRADNPSPVYFAILGLFLAYSLGAAARPFRSTMFGLLVLFGDTVIFLIVTANGNERSLWLAAVFYLFLIVEAMVQHSPREVGMVAGISVLFGAVMPTAAIGLLERTLVVGGVLGCAFAVARKRLDERVETLTRELAEARQAPEKAVEAERSRIAADFHDGPLQSFISLQMRLEILRKLLERDAAAGMEDLRQLQSLAQEQVRALRVFLRSMRPMDVDGANLFASARRTAEMFQKESGIPVTFVSSNSPTTVAPEVAQEILQMLREALHNVQKHAGATRVAVAMEKTERGLEISVDDNGVGFNFVGSYTLDELELLRLGPASLKRRARSLNAEMTLDSKPGRGAGLRVRIPMA